MRRAENSISSLPKPKNIEPASTRLFHRFSANWSYALLLAVVVFFAVVRVRWSNLPLERDEGEYAYSGQLILHGIAPYQFCYTMKLPGTAAMYALAMAIFGQTAAGIRLGLLLANSGTILLMYFLANRLFGKLGGVVAAACLAVLSISPSVLGFAAHATQFVILFAVAGSLVLLKAIASQKLIDFFCSGTLMGLALLMKQPGIFFLLFAAFWIIRVHWKHAFDWPKAMAQLGALVAGAVLPLLVTTLLLLWTGVFGKFWFWTVTYAREYGTFVPLSDGLQLLWTTLLPIITAAWLVWLIAGAGIVAMLWDPETENLLGFELSFLAFSFAATCPGFHFRNHYFVLVLPAIALLCAGGVCAATNLLRGSAATRQYVALPVALLLLALGFSIVNDRDFLFATDRIAAYQKLYRGNPFSEALQISDFIRSHSTPQDRVAVIGSEPEIYFYANRLSATGYVYMYPLMEPQPFASMMQTQMIGEIESTQPRFVVIIDNPVSWLTRPDSDRTILNWSGKYVSTSYRLVGIVDMQKTGTEYHWADSSTYQPVSPYKVLVFDRRNGVPHAP